MPVLPIDQHTTSLYRPEQNCLLGSLPAQVQARLFPWLDLTPLPSGKSISEPGDTARHVYFPVDCIVSLLHVMENGESGEISVVGREGVVGVALLMGGDSTNCRAMVRNAGVAYRLPGQRLKSEFDRHGELLHMLLRHTHSLITQMAQTAVCNRHHSIEQQLCRWLLLSLDRLNGSALTTTHELIANLLGVRRERVTEASGQLQRLGLIEHRRGSIDVIDRPGLEQLSCECYHVVTPAQ